MATAPLFGKGAVPAANKLANQAAGPAGAAPKALAGSKPQVPAGKFGGAAPTGKPSSPFKGAGASPKGGNIRPPSAVMKKAGRGR